MWVSSFRSERKVQPFYVEDFSTVQDPLSRGGIWGFQGKDVGAIWCNTRVVFIPGVGNVCVGTQQDFATNDYDDSNALLTRNFGPDVVSKATIYINPSLTGTTHEVALLHRRTTTDHVETGYEFLLAFTNNVQIMKWSAPFGPWPTFTDLTVGQNALPPLVTGNVLKVSVQGTAFKMFVNNILVATATDSDFTNGRQGLNFFTRPGSPDNDYGFTDFQVRTIDGSFNPDTW